MRHIGFPEPREESFPSEVLRRYEARFGAQGEAGGFGLDPGPDRMAASDGFYPDDVPAEDSRPGEFGVFLTEGFRSEDAADFLPAATRDALLEAFRAAAMAEPPRTIGPSAAAAPPRRSDPFEDGGFEETFFAGLIPGAPDGIEAPFFEGPEDGPPLFDAGDSEAQPFLDSS